MNEQSIFIAALERDATERSLYLDEVCGGNSDLRRRIEKLLAVHEHAANFMDQPAAPFAETIVQPAAAEKVGVVIGQRYKLLEQIGEGGMGTVWVAEQTEPVRRRVALKLIKPGMDTRQVIARFEAERQALALMDHPNIAKVFDGGLTETGRPFFVMEYFKGVPITEYCDATRLSVSGRLQLFVQVCQAVQHAHQKGIIHRDLKPSNILVALYDDKPVPKVIDFGLAKAMHHSLTERTLYTAHETILGTPLYMSPEQTQLNNLDVDTRADVYSLGVLLYELLTGTTPLEKRRFKEAAWDEIRRIIREEEPPLPSSRLSSSMTLPSLAAGRQTEPLRLTKLVRGELDWVVMKALEKDRNRRYETANAFAQDVQHYLADEPVLAAPPSARYRLRKLARKYRTALTTAAAIAVLLVGGAAVSTWQAVRASRAEGVAREKEQEARNAQLAETERAEGERMAKQDALARQAEAERQTIRAEAGEKKAEEEKRIAQAVRDFLQDKLLGQTATVQQADALLKTGGSTADVTNNPTIRELLDRAANELAEDKIESSFPDQPVVQAQLLLTVGDAYSGIGAYERAIRFLERAVALLREHLGPRDSDTLIAMNNLAIAYIWAERPELAVPLAEETLALTKEKFGRADRETLIRMNTLSFAYWWADKQDLALKLMEETFDLLKATLGPDDPLTLVGMGNLAQWYGRTGNQEVGLRFMQETLKLQQAKLGPEHPNTLTTMGNLASIYQDVGKLDVAMALMQQTIEFQKEKLGADHPHTLLNMHSYARMCQQAGMLDVAESLMEEVVTMQKAKLGRDRPQTLVSMGTLGVIYAEAKKLDKASPLLEETLELCRTKFGPDHPTTVASEWNLGFVYRKAGKHDLALPLMKVSFERSKAIRKLDDPIMLDHMESLAKLYHETGNLHSAVQLIEEKLKLVKDKFGPDDRNTLVCMNHLAVMYHAMGKPELALPLMEELLKLANAHDGPDHPDTLANMNVLADMYQHAGKLDLALALRERVAELTKAKFGAEHDNALAAFRDLAEAYLSLAARHAWLGEDAEYAKMCSRALKFAMGTDDLTTRERVAKACVLRPADDTGRLTLALPLARQAVERGIGHPFLPYFQTTLGMAEYRSGHFAEADAALLAAMNAGKGNTSIAGIGAFYHAMSLFRQGKHDEARRLATEAASKMKPLPNDQQAPRYHDDLILWLAYKEATALLAASSESAPDIPAQSDRK